jgi:hypothetical protein
MEKGPTDQQKKDDLERVSKALQILTEFFDTAQIFVSRYDSASGQTLRIDKGAGNWYARLGQTSAWVTREEEILRCEGRDYHKTEEN